MQKILPRKRVITRRVHRILKIRKRRNWLPRMAVKLTFLLVSLYHHISIAFLHHHNHHPHHISIVFFHHHHRHHISIVSFHHHLNITVVSLHHHHHPHYISIVFYASPTRFICFFATIFYKRLPTAIINSFCSNVRLCSVVM